MFHFRDFLQPKSRPHKFFLPFIFRLAVCAIARPASWIRFYVITFFFLFFFFFFFFFNRHYNPKLGFGLLNCRWAFSAGRFYRVPLPAARSTPNLEENQGFRAFQLSPQEAPSVWSDASEPSSGRWNCERQMAEKFRRKWRLPRHFWVLLHAVKHDMGQTALLPLRRKARWGFFRPKNPTASVGF
jgi:hypothetical protein